jgi:hypothetical protein
LFLFEGRVVLCRRLTVSFRPKVAVDIEGDAFKRMCESSVWIRHDDTAFKRISDAVPPQVWSALRDLRIFGTAKIVTDPHFSCRRKRRTLRTSVTSYNASFLSGHRVAGSGYIPSEKIARPYSRSIREQSAARVQPVSSPPSSPFFRFPVASQFSCPFPPGL